MANVEPGKGSRYGGGGLLGFIVVDVTDISIGHSNVDDGNDAVLLPFVFVDSANGFVIC